jgi:hypothetical protein
MMGWLLQAFGDVLDVEKCRHLSTVGRGGEGGEPTQESQSEKKYKGKNL